MLPKYKLFTKYDDYDDDYDDDDDDDDYDDDDFIVIFTKKFFL